RLGVHANLRSHVRDGEPRSRDAAAKSLVRHPNPPRCRYRDVFSVLGRPDTSAGAVSPSRPTALQWGVATGPVAEPEPREPWTVEARVGREIQVLKRSGPGAVTRPRTPEHRVRSRCTAVSSACPDGRNLPAIGPSGGHLAGLPQDHRPGGPTRPAACQRTRGSHRRYPEPAIRELAASLHQEVRPS